MAKRKSENNIKRDEKEIEEIEKEREEEIVEEKSEKKELVEGEEEDLYKLLELNKDCNENEIKKAYYKKALRYHPDKQHNLKEEDKPLILKRFQKLQQAYNILSDPLKRKNYDLGVPIEGLESITKTFEEWSDYFKEAFSGKVTESAIEKLKEEYVGSEEEKNDILSYYQKYEGNMDKIIESVMFADCDNEDRITNIIKGSVDKDDRLYKTFKKTITTKFKMQRKLREKKETEEFKKESAKSQLSSLALAIKANQKERGKMADSFFDHLEQKYSKQPEKKRNNQSSSKNKSAKKVKTKTK